MNTDSRRSFLRRSLAVGGAVALTGPLRDVLASTDKENRAKMKFGLCTYTWGQDWDLPTIIANCKRAGVLGVELRTQHKHGVEPAIPPRERGEVKRRFADSPITLVGLGTNECFDSPDPRRVAQAIEATKAFLQLSHDCGATGVKVKPNDLHANVPHEKTIEQIGRSLNVVGKFAADLGQQIRLEVHGSCCELPTMKQIMDVVDHPNVAVCWNCNDADLKGKGLEHNFNLIGHRLGATAHVHELNVGSYPYRQLFELLVHANYTGWVLLEGYAMPMDPAAAILEQNMLFERMSAVAR